ncbi:putative DNA modification/repair radical SAM protein, partial [Desulfovibrio sp. OttesenSCG-928-C06]|nr:putative DNA modification/repair radical SAM protein [Desulfovibrio sp. OttesenSCG-928-C06]
RRNYIEGLFLSSGVMKSPDHTMMLLVDVLRELRVRHRFNGYIHMKCIPGASQELVRQAGFLADRLSVNIEIPSETSLKRLAPEKDHQSVYLPMRHIREGVQQYHEERGRFRNAPQFAPAGQSTQLIVGASAERDRDILLLSSSLYKGPELRRVYYSGFVPVNAYDSRLPVGKPVPLVRENRLYQADWLMRFYHFEAEEILDAAQPDLDLEVDPKIAWALRHPEFFPVDVNRDDYAVILRVPGIGIKSAQRIVAARRYRTLTAEHLRRIGVVMGRAKYFLADLSGLRELHEQRTALEGQTNGAAYAQGAAGAGGMAQAHGAAANSKAAQGRGGLAGAASGVPVGLGGLGGAAGSGYSGEAGALADALDLPVARQAVPAQLPRLRQPAMLGRKYLTIQEAGPEYVRRALLGSKRKRAPVQEQYSLFA